MLESGAPFSFADLVERVSPAVVTITAIEQESAADQQAQLDDLPAPFRDFFNQFNQGRQLQPRKAVSMGSGFIIDKSGIIVTNNHVIDGAKKITVKLPDGRSFDAQARSAPTPPPTSPSCASRATSRFRPSSSATTASFASATGWSRSAIRSAFPTP